MTVRKILTIPDPLLKQVANPVEEITPQIKHILNDLSDTTDASPGFALAAPQIGEMIRAICVDAGQAKRKTKTPHGKILLINPRIIAEKKPQINREGCLSVPQYTADISRYQQITVEGLTANGEQVSLDSKGWEAIALQHEIDHLDGILFLDRIASIKNDLFKRKTG
ncbi:MAG: peptide deformylase [bacterium]